MNSNINQEYFGSGENGGGNTYSATASVAQTEVINAKNYSQADVGDNPAVNLAIGRLKYIFSDLSVGHGNFNIAISHVYNSKLCEQFRGNIVGLGRNWKLNLSQSIVKENNGGNNEYKYMDDLGEIHRFVPFASNRYYDDRNAKVTLTDNMFGCVISDGVGNELHFDSDGLLSKSVSCQDSSIEKIYTYDEQKRLVSVYDTRTVKNKVPKSSIKFTYDGDYLTSVTSYGDFNRKLFCLTYEYSDGNLVSVNKVAFNKSGEQCLSQQIAEFCYKDNSLYRIIDSQTKQAYQFEYANGKLAKMSSGVIVDKTLSLGMTDSQGTPLQLGQVQCEGTFSREFVTKSVNSYKYTMYSDTDPVAVQTDVTNNNNITLTYFIDRNACITSCFEKVGTDLKTLNKQGAKRISKSSANSTQTINGYYGIVPSEYGNPSWIGDIVFTADGGLARNKAEQNVRNYEYSFWLKIPKAYECMQARIEYTFASWAGKTRIERVYVDGQAVNAWQRVSLPVTVPVDSDGNIDTSELTFWISLSGNKATVKDRFEINEIGFTPAPYTEMLLANHNAIDIPFNKCTKATLGVMDGSYNITSQEYVLNRDIFFTETDVIATRTNEYAHKYYTIGQELFDVICNNGTKRIPNVSYLLFDNPNGGYSATSDIPFVIRTVTPDGGMTTTTKYTYGSTSMTIVTTGQRGDVTSATAVVTDYTGKIINESDEYNVSTQYEYDGYGRLTKTTVYASDRTVGAVENYSYNEDGSLYSADNGLNGQRYTYDEHEQLNRITMLEYGGEDGSLKATEYSTETKYGVFRDQPLEVSEHIGIDTVARNKVTYEKGRIRTVTDGTAKYGVKYDDVNSTVEYTQFDGDTEYDIQTDSIQRNADGTQTHTSTYSLDKTETMLDAYGNVQKVQKKYGNYSDSETFNYTYENNRESKFSSKPSKLTSGNKETEYSYDYDGNLTGWTDKENGKSTLEVTRVSPDVIKYTFGGNKQELFAAVERDKSVVLEPRITSVKYLEDWNTKYDNPSPSPQFQFDYKTDSFGFVTEKTTQNKGKNSKTAYSYTRMGGVTKLTGSEFNGTSWHGTSQRNKCQCKYVLTYTYDDKGEITQIKDDVSWQKDYDPALDVRLNNTRKYKYDSLNRLVSEEQNGKTNTYEYLPDGRLSYVNGTQYFYSKNTGKLYRVGETQYFYDNYGNRRKKMTVGEKIKEYVFRNNLLAEIDLAYKPYVTYGYTVDGIRCRKEYNGVTTQYILDGGKILGEVQSGNGVESNYFDGKRYITYIYDCEGIAYTKIGETTYELVKDALGNVVMIIDHDDGSVACLYRYDALGNCTVLDGQGRADNDKASVGNVNPIRWKSFYYDVETGLYYANGSYYDPETGQYLNASPVSGIIENAYERQSLDRHAPICNNILELAGEPSTVSSTTELMPSTEYDAYGNAPWYIQMAIWYSRLHWGIKLGIGIGLLVGAIGLTLATGGGGAEVAGIITEVVIGVGTGIGLYAINSLSAGTFSWQGLGNAALDSFLVTTAIVFVCAGINYINYLCRSKPVSTAELAQNTHELTDAELRTFGELGKNQGFRQVTGTHEDAMDFVISQTKSLTEYAPEKLVGYNSRGVEFRIYARFKVSYTSIRITGVQGLKGIKFMWP